MGAAIADLLVNVPIAVFAFSTFWDSDQEHVWDKESQSEVRAPNVNTFPRSLTQKIQKLLHDNQRTEVFRGRGQQWQQPVMGEYVTALGSEWPIPRPAILNQSSVEP